MSDRVLRHLRWSELDAAERDRFLRRGIDIEDLDPSLVASVRRLIDDVRASGDVAVARALAEFDRCEIAPRELAVAPTELAGARNSLPDSVLAAIRESIGRVRRFNERVIAEREWGTEIEPGVHVGERLGPIASAGLFVPSGKGSYPSSLIHIATPAVVAGVPEITVVVPPIPGEGGRVDPAVLAVAAELGIEKVFRVNGPAGIAALAFGTESIPRALMVLGPGSLPVQLAQVEVQRHGTATVMVLGPTECMVIADGTADPRLAAADLLTEAEHGADSAAVLVTPDPGLVDAVEAELARRLQRLPARRADYARSALGQVGGAVVVDDLAEAADVANAYAPEHLQIATERPEELARAIEHAAEILLGQATAFALANYTIGVPAALPTSRFARISSGVTAASFVKRTSIARLSERAAESLSPAAHALAEWEGFPAHDAAVEERRPIETIPEQEVM